MFYIIWRGAVAIVLNDCTIGDPPKEKLESVRLSFETLCSGEKLFDLPVSTTAQLSVHERLTLGVDYE